MTRVGGREWLKEVYRIAQWGYDKAWSPEAMEAERQGELSGTGVGVTKAIQRRAVARRGAEIHALPLDEQMAYAAEAQATIEPHITKQHTFLFISYWVARSDLPTTFG